MSQLAELNIAVPLHPLDSPAMAGFVDNLDRINALAERSPGFVWRLIAPATAADPMDVIPNLSVWDDVRSLEHFVFGTIHRQIYAQRADWFPKLKTRHFVMWWVDDGHQPDLAEAYARLDHLDRQGNSNHAFDWAHVPGLTRHLAAACTTEPA